MNDHRLHYSNWSRIHFVPIDLTFTSYDYKTNPSANVVKTKDGKILSNLMTEESPIFGALSWRGGLQGLDGMHPTIVGYTIMAQQILNAIHDVEKVPVPTLDVEAAYKADSLLQNVPACWDTVLYLWRDIREASATGGIAPMDVKAAPVRALMDAVQFKID